MRILSLLLLTIGSALAGPMTPEIDPEKFTVCSVTINSSDEKEIFSSHIEKNPKKFNPIIELTDMGDHDWFDKACKSGIRCDQLIISGHFAGTFFGDSSKTLSLRELESAGCSKTCENILAKPYEVFLFGCNTLASKNNDHRTPAQYYQVLINDGFSPQRAEMIVQSRYGEVGDSNRASMQRAFGGEKKQLYGFHSTGPLGKQIRPFLNNYFKKIEPATHLEKLQAKRMMDKVSFQNSLLEKTLNHKNFYQCEAGNTKNKVSEDICRLYDKNIKLEEKFTHVVDLLSKENFLVYMPAINDFFKDHPVSSFTDAQKDQFSVITKNEVLKSQILGMIDKTKSLALKFEWSQFAFNMGYLSQDQQNTILKKEILKIFKKPVTLAYKDLLCSVFNEDPKAIVLDPSEINIKLGQNEYQALKCMKAYDVIFDKTNDEENLILSMNHMFSDKNKVYPDRVINKLKVLARSKSVVQNASILYLADIVPQDKDLYALLGDIVKTRDHQLMGTAIQAYGKIKLQDVQLQKEILNYIKDSYQGRNFLASYLIDIKPTDPSIVSEIKALLLEPSLSDYHRREIEDYLKLF